MSGMGARLATEQDMGTSVVNANEVPDDLAPGTYCCRLDESSTMRELRLRFVTPPRVHVPGDCLVQVVKHETGAVETGQAEAVTMGDAIPEAQS